MRVRLAVLASLLVATGAPAQDEPDFYQPDLDVLEAKLARVGPPQANFYSGIEKTGCPAMTPACRRAAYLRAGDVVVVGTAKGPFVEAHFTAGGTRSTTGWLLRSALVPLPVRAVTAADWRGDWVRDRWANISLKPGKRPGTLAITGDASWPTPGGSINMGDLNDMGAPRGDRLSIGGTDQYECRVRMRLLPPYLIVAENGKCGGLNVTFSGVYRRAQSGR